MKRITGSLMPHGLHQLPVLLGNEILSKSKETIKAESGIAFDPFIKKYPIEIDDMEVERVKMEILSNTENNYFDKKITAAEQLAKIKEDAEREVSEIMQCSPLHSIYNPLFEFPLRLFFPLSISLDAMPDEDHIH